MIPERIPINGLAIAENASVLLAFSATEGINVVTVPTESRLVIISHEASAARPEVPSWSSDIPTPTPITNRIDILSINAPPAFTRKKPNLFKNPTISPPCIVAGQHAYPIPIKIPQIGRHATGSIRDLPSFCKYFFIKSLPPYHGF